MKARSVPELRIVVLAAGFSARLGQPKALARIHGRTLLQRTLWVLAPFAGASQVIVVIPAAAGRYKIGSCTHAAAFLSNPLRASGLSSSVRLGLRRARAAAGVLLLPVDLAGLARRDIARLIARWRGARRRVAARRVRDAPGVPLILPRWLYARARELTGDHGLREVVRRLPPADVVLLALPSASWDVDTPRDLERARRRVRPREP
jgi:molybdenum cofactor cytidylyltransferase